MLLFRGADKSIRNLARHTAAELAALSANTGLVDLITKFNPDDIGKYKQYFANFYVCLTTC